jgi:hypothetical protein
LKIGEHWVEKHFHVIIKELMTAGLLGLFRVAGAVLEAVTDEARMPPAAALQT